SGFFPSAIRMPLAPSPCQRTTSAILRLADSIAQENYRIAVFQLYGFAFLFRCRRNSWRNAAKFQLPVAPGMTGLVSLRWQCAELRSAGRSTHIAPRHIAATILRATALSG